MIPKVIHYCWFGRNPLPKDTLRYIETWKKYCPDYKIIQWNEDNFDVNQNKYCKEAYDSKKWAFVSDYVRLRVLRDFGGVYMDADVELCKNIDELLHYNAWSGFESDNSIPTGTIASCKDGEWISYLLSYYDEKSFFDSKGNFDLTTNVVTITNMTKEKYDIRLDNSFQVFGDNNVIFPFDFFCAKNYFDGKVKKTNNTYTIHHFAGSWLTTSQKIRIKFKLLLISCLGKKNTEALIKLIKGQ